MSYEISKKRHIAKTITWRIIASATTFILAKLFGLPLDKALYVAGTEFFIKMIFYYYHERVWYKYNFGVNHKRENND
ncbi:MAG: hypothetical protein COA97_09280 [Flavobacteriales bacterium]|nr:MAG: hypothetical protein COA97_09280 [Flavobacteriales bacterium]